MPIRSRFVAAVLTLALGFVLGADRASAQAMVSYGHGVAKAAGAGAAVGGGIGGVLTGLGNPLSKAADRRGGPAKQTATVQRQTVPARRGSVTWDVPRSGFGAPAPLPLVGGVQVNGGTAANWQPTLLEPQQNLAVISASWGGPNVEEPQAAAEAASDEAPAEELIAETAGETGSDAKPPLPIVLRSTGQGGKSKPAVAAQQGAAVPAALPEGVEVGLGVDELLEKLGRPYLSFRGVAGDGYSDQYVFQLPDGAHLVVYVLDGVVAHLSVG